MQNIFHLSYSEMGIALLIGAALSLLYLYLLWQTLLILPRVRRKGVFLFLSSALRIFLLMCIALLLSENNAGKFILIFAGFIAMRLLVMRFVKRHINGGLPARPRRRK